MSTQQSLLDAIEIIPVSPARKSDPPTAHAAANAFPEVRGEQRIRVLLAFYDRGELGATDYRISQILKINRCSAGKRRGELTGFAKGQKVGPEYITITDRTEETDGGVKAVVWQITDLGREVAERIRERANQ